MKFTFKKHQRTGRYRCFQLNHTDIKIGGRMVGQISETKDEGWRIGFTVKKEVTEKHPAPFRWIFLKKKAQTEENARNIVIGLTEQIQGKFDLYPFEKED